MCLKPRFVILFLDAILLITSYINCQQLCPIVPQPKAFLSLVHVLNSLYYSLTLPLKYIQNHQLITVLPSTIISVIIVTNCQLTFLIPPFSPQSLFLKHVIKMYVRLCHIPPQKALMAFHFLQIKCEITIMALHLEIICCNYFTACSVLVDFFLSLPGTFQSWSFALLFSA